MNTALSAAEPVSESNLLAFVHLPKTAGTSVRYALQNQLPPGTLLILERNENLFYLECNQWQGITVAIGHFALPLIKMFGARRWATCLRHPIERCISQVQHWLRPATPEPEYDQLGLLQPAFEPQRGVAWNLDMILERGEGERFDEISNAMTYQLVDDSYFRWLPPDHQCLRVAEQTLETAACLGITEDGRGLERGLGGVFGIFGALRRENISQSSSRDIVTSLPPVTRRRLERINELDLALYDKAVALIGTHGWHGIRHDRASDDAPEIIYRSERVRLTNREFMAQMETEPRDLSMRAAHALLDIAEFTSGLGLRGDECVVGRIKPADMMVLQASLDTAQRIIEFDMTCNEYCDWRADKGDSLMRTWIQARSLSTRLMSCTHRIAFALDRHGYVLLLNALTGNGFEPLPDLCRILATTGFRPLAAIDDHVLFCNEAMRSALAALLKAKFAQCTVERIVIAGLSSLQIISDY